MRLALPLCTLTLSWWVSSCASSASLRPSSAPTDLTADERARDEALRPVATAFLQAFANHAALITDGGAVAFISNRDGLDRLYVGDRTQPELPPRRLPGPDERVSDLALTADEQTVLFTSDVGADENFHIFRVGLDGTDLRDLTPTGTLHRDAPLIARARPELFFFSAHAPSSEATTLYQQRLDQTTAQSIYTDPRGGELVDVSPDGRRALFMRLNSDQDQVLFEVALPSGQATRIYPAEGQPCQLRAKYSANADRILVADQRAGRPPRLLALTDGHVVAEYRESHLTTAAVADLAVSPRGDSVALTLNAGNHREVRLLDGSSLAPGPDVTTPLGSISLGRYTRDGRFLSVTESSPDLPTDIFSVAVSNGSVAPLRHDARPGLTAMAPLTVTIESIANHDGDGDGDGGIIPTNLYLPAHAAGQRLPVLVAIHGGPAASASIRWSSVVRFYAAQGYAIVEPNIRGSTGFGVAYEQADNKGRRGEALRDVESVNRWARAQPWCDPGRLVIMGGSSGGYMTLLALGRQPSLWRAGLDISGMSDLRTMERLEDQSIRVYDETEFGVLGKEDELLYAFSPLKFVDSVVAPVFIYQGARDPITPQNEADQMVRALRKRHIPVEYMLLRNEGHGIARRENYAWYLARTIRFLEEHASATPR